MREQRPQRARIAPRIYTGADREVVSPEAAQIALAELRSNLVTPCSACGRIGTALECEGGCGFTCVDSAACHRAHKKVGKSGDVRKPAGWRGWGRS